MTADHDLAARRDAALGRSYRLFYDRPVHPVRAEGVWLHDADGTAYLDCYNNVPCIGHCHPRVTQALATQAARLNTHTRYLDETIVAYAEDLLALLPPGLDRLNLTCTGSEANDLALRVAMQVTGGRGVVVTDWAYHGGTVAVAGISPSLVPQVPGHVRAVAPPNPRAQDMEAEAARFAQDVAAAFADLSAAGHAPCALVLDTILSSDGIIADPPGLLRGAEAAARSAGALVIADEVQAGFGRIGASFWGFARHGMQPDMVTLGKPMGAGHPIAGLVLRADLAEQFGRETRYFNTFGGNPVSCAVAQTVLDVLREEELPQNADRVGASLQAGLRDLATRHTEIADVRGAGLFIGVDIAVRDDPDRPDPARAAALVEGLKTRGVLLSTSARAGNVLKIRPPLVFSDAHAARLLDALAAELSALA
ncbi:aspartate aminotransferase family protein (plasmid) [Pacificitalea manganoxidans]|uniref:Aspartate aminotransferase family protein n=1 Tax=Pacificitalea manganoxidans TaxID=1411902 RepID=A0A291M3U8_9RHOB|nr:aspartate aminotransferase family protein [Pacificitalea manganoxidans]ATI43609.1 aspartate aminotransferase family protein [Pacificitalea manganoxidans]MDR6309952.1 4-aminobutyrate aminotransferase-like enzyme [Pacificitalea manganoxidans]